MSPKNKNSILSLLNSIDQSKVNIPNEILELVENAPETLKALGVVRQELIKGGLNTDVKKLDQILQKQTKLLTEKKSTLYPNEITQDCFGISSVVSDPFAKILDMDDQYIRDCYDANALIINFGKNKKDKKRILLKHPMLNSEFSKSPEDFIEAINLWRNPRTLQHWCACWNWACENNSFRFPYIPIGDLMETVYAKSKKTNKFKTRDKKAFTQSLDLFHNTTIETPVVIISETKNGKKTKEHATKMSRLMDLNLAKRNKKGDTILKVAGAILPDLGASNFRGRCFPKGIFNLNANKDGNRILLTYVVSNRFDQTNNKHLSWSVDKLIDIAGLRRTHIANPSAACKKLTRTLEQLIATECIVDFSPKKISAKTKVQIKIYPII